MPVTVLLADDHPVVRSGLRAWLREAGIEVAGEATDGDAATRMVESLRPSCVVLEVMLPKRDGFRCMSDWAELPASAPPVLVYTAHENPTYAARANALGAAGFLSKSAPASAVIDAIRTICGGGACWPSELMRQLTGSLATPAASTDRPTSLTAREAEVLKQLAFGLSNKEIAQALGISYETVKEHVQHILRKLSVSDRTQAAVWAVRQGMA